MSRRYQSWRESVEYSLPPPALGDRIGVVPRRLTFEDASVFETLANDAIDVMVAGHVGFVHRLERFHPRLIVIVPETMAAATLRALDAAAFARYCDHYRRIGEAREW